MEKYKKDFIDFLVKNEALKFGEFTLKSGRISPYFFSTGKFNTGANIYQLGYFYASKIIKDKTEFDLIFGPAYKGIPLAIAMASALAKDFNLDKPYLFDRKEIKDYADKSAFVGYEPKEGEKILMIDDVMTTGQTKIEAVKKLQSKFPGVEFSGLLIAFDRQENDSQGNNAIQQFTRQFKIPVRSIVTISEVKEYLYPKVINDKTKQAIEDYLSEYGS